MCWKSQSFFFLAAVQQANTSVFERLSAFISGLWLNCDRKTRLKKNNLCRNENNVCNNCLMMLFSASVLGIAAWIIQMLYRGVVNCHSLYGFTISILVIC